jgi:hypothetical protein
MRSTSSLDGICRLSAGGHISLAMVEDEFANATWASPFPMVCQHINVYSTSLNLLSFQKTLSTGRGAGVCKFR